MEISQRQEFPAPPQQVIAMLTDEAYLKQVAEETHARDYTVSVDGMHTTTSRSFDTPSAATKFAGPTITIVEDVTWGAASGDGSRDGTLDLTAPGLPVTMNGRAHLAPGGAGTIVTYDGEFRINIPFIGKKLEQQAAPAATEALAAQERVGKRWLAEHQS